RCYAAIRLAPLSAQDRARDSPRTAMDDHALFHRLHLPGTPAHRLGSGASHAPRAAAFLLGAVALAAGSHPGRAVLRLHFVFHAVHVVPRPREHSAATCFLASCAFLLAVTVAHHILT